MAWPSSYKRRFEPPLHCGIEVEVVEDVEDEAMALGGAWKSAKPYLAMVFLQVGYSGMYVVSVASLKRGMSHYVLVVYRNAVAAVVVAPFALWPVLDQNFYYMGAKDTSASEIFHFLYLSMEYVDWNIDGLFFVIRMEKIDIKKRRSQAKVVGTLVTVIGALLMILYTGPAIEFVRTKGRSHHADDGSKNESHWLVGTFMLLFRLSLSTLICLTGAGQSGALALVMERSAKPWSIGFDTRLFTAVYSGIMCSGIAYYVQGMVMKERGPVFVTAFNPLCMIITAITSSIILAEEITLGRLLGAVIIVIGLYFLIWGKSKDHLMQPSETMEKDAALRLPKVADDANKTTSIDHVTVIDVQPSKHP
ncbi:hypothetical protein BHE74_00038489 [Ensete ventricosum]|nr:hypothetical protein BHE74_00038489 [Ensete ventricosum]